MKLLFVCTGNTCRSAMAQGIADKLIADNPQQFGHIQVASAGTYTTEGQTASPNAVIVAQEHDIDLGQFTSQSVSPQLIQQSDLVLAMTGNHKKLLNTLADHQRDKIFLLKEYELGADVNQLNKEVKEYYDLYVQAKDQFVKGHQQELQQLDELTASDPAAAKELFERLNQQLAETVATIDQEVTKRQDILQSMDIVDPFGGDVQTYRQCFVQLQQAIEAVFYKLVNENNL